MTTRTKGGADRAERELARMRLPSRVMGRLWLNPPPLYIFLSPCLRVVCSELFLVYILHWAVGCTTHCKLFRWLCLLALVGVGTRIFAFARHTHASSGPSSPSASFDHAKRRLDS